MDRKKLKSLRLAAGLTQFQLGWEAGVSREMVSALENGRSEAGFATLAALANVLNVTIAELLLP